MSIGVKGNPNRFWVKDGNVCPLADRMPAEYLIDSEDSLEALKAKVLPGSVAYTAEGRRWIFGPDGEWTENLKGHGSKGVDKGVNFIDYDGTILYSYTPDEIASLKTLPRNPSHKGLTAQGWNWSLDDILVYLAKYPDACMTVGQMYIPDDGKTRLVVHIGPRMTLPLYIQQTVSEGVTIDWGDGSETETIEGTGVVNTEHTYTTEGDYTISLEVAEGCTLDFGGTIDNTSYNIFDITSVPKFIVGLKEVHIGDSVTSIDQSAFANCFVLSSLTIPDSVTSIDQSAFSGCYVLTNLTIPDSVASIGQYAFANCFALSSLTISDSVTSIGNRAFANCFVLSSLTIPDSVASIGQYAFANCSVLSSLTIPDSVTSIDQSAFSGCYVLTNLTIPDSVTSIDQSAFSGCCALTNLTIPDSVTSIGNRAFYGCYALANLTILAQTPPTLANVNAFNYLLSDCTIYVPHGKGDTYKAASGWSTWASQIQELPEAPETPNAGRKISPKLLEAVAQRGLASQAFDIGDEIIIPYTDYSGDEPVYYDYPFVVANIADCYDENYVKHEDAIWLTAKLASPYDMIFDEPEVNAASGTFQEGLHYFTKNSDNSYTEQTVTVGDTIPAGYYVHRFGGSNGANIIRYGYNNYKESAIRQWLNSEAPKSANWWTAQHDWDVTPSTTYTNEPGWIYGFPDEWRRVFKKVRVRVAANMVTDEERTDTMYDKFFLPSVEELYGSPQLADVEGPYWPYWKEVTGLESPSNGDSSHTNDARKVKAVTAPVGSAVFLHLRSARRGSSGTAWGVNSGGYLNGSFAYGPYRSQPACVIF